MTTPPESPTREPITPPPIIAPSRASSQPPFAPRPVGPVGEADRLKSLDVTRAVALLGIFFVNAAFFGLPFGEMVNPDPPTHEGTPSVIAHAFTHIFCAGKFYPLFSLLFGVGLAMMFRSALSAGRSFGWPAARRLLALACFGVLHIVLLWPGDILLTYAFIGVLMVWLARLTPKLLMILSAVALLIGVTLSSLFGLLGPMMESQLANLAPPPPLDPAYTFYQQLLEVMGSQMNVYDPRMIDLEISALRDGPFAHAMVIRIVLYLSSLVFVALAMAPQVIACFCFGAALLKIGYFNAQHLWLRTVFIVVGLVIALPLNVLGYALTPDSSTSYLAGAGAMFCMALGGPLTSLMYLTLIMIAVEKVPSSRVAGVLAPLGRMGLTGYIGESLLMCFVMQHWGLRLFAQTTWAERFVLVLVVWATLVLFANLWFRHFRFGPLEWLWRSVTYWRWQPMSKAPGPA